MHPLTFQVLDLTGQTQRLLALLLLAVVVVVHKMLKLAQMVVRAAAVGAVVPGPTAQEVERPVKVTTAVLAVGDRRSMALVVVVAALSAATLQVTVGTAAQEPQMQSQARR